MSSEYGGGYDGGMKMNFALIVVLFILLIIVGVSFVHKGY
ncbi:YjcZ family sporulation protein [Oceanobacillus piezotolerans]|uniref:YjcZ family sporulation protein n=1 Tax=Oceanobacillus piezotolerans TaxID=2448030 RepID=A0A498DDX3_9BACI|nr:YjcZ family sporulation protein [Oceanobacillus piezotolerans]RLL48402.1 YjcZ family sporulation protein [Oceanobacillus piezotolerans]